MIFETIITSMDLAGKPHVTPFGVRHENENIIISPYKPSTTLANILATKRAVMNLTDDVRVFAGAVCKKQNLPALQTNGPDHPLSNSLHEFDSPCIHAGYRLADCLAHVELELLEVRDDATRPELIMKKVAEFNHKPFAGFNRAQAAVIELAVLVSRLHMLPREKIQTELQYLQIAIDKTAGERELEAWGWLVEKIGNFTPNNWTDLMDKGQI
jgi:hypothetical protein